VPVERLVLATANEDKAREIVAIVEAACGSAIVLLPRPPDVPEVEETGETLEENALLKAHALAAAAGLPALADDTGLEVDALGGAPGVFSSRYSGEHATYAENVAKLLREMSGATDRRARFRTVAALSVPGGEPILAEGSVEGEIATEARGAGGFGYDPVFVPAGAGGRTFAEMDLAEKNAWSHRGRAFRAMAAKLAASRPSPPP
jgi:XTP/dITP diphosphohydrolase